MKKLFYTSLIVIAGLFAASCEQEHIEAVYDPADVTAQTLGEISGVELSSDGEDIIATFNPADFNMAVAKSYTLYASSSADMSDKVKVSSKITVDGGIGQIKLLQKDINSLVYALGGAADEPFTVYFQLSASIANDKNGSIASTTIQSNIVEATFTPYSTLIKDEDLYEHVWVIGNSDYTGNWSHDKVYQFLYDYEKSGTTFTGLVDFGENHSDNQFKFTGAAGWEDATGNWGVADGEETAEAATLQLANGSNTNIWQYTAKRFYAFSLNTNTLVLTKLYSFDNIGIVGAFNGWNAGDAEMKMTYNDHLHRFYIDYTFGEATELKFTCDDSWDLNWGGEDGAAVPGGANIAVEPASYRIYFDPNKAEYEFSTSMFGKEEPTGEDGGNEDPEPTYTGWGIIGAFNEWGGDAPMTEKDGVWTGYFTNIADGEFKLRKDADWAENYGGTLVSLDTPFEAVAGGNNIITSAEGFYKVVLDLSGDTPMITVSEGKVWSLIGAFNDWGGDVDMEEVDGKWVSPATTLSGEFKLRYNHDWDVNRGGTFTSVGVAFDAVDGGANINVPEGEYIVTYDPEAETIIVEGALPSNTWSLIGVGGDWANDIFMTQLGSGLWVSPVVEFGGEFKLRYNHDWGVNRGGTYENNGVSFAVTQDGSNINVPDGKYQIIYNPALETVIVNSTASNWSIIGAIEGHNWDYDLYMSETSSQVFESEVFLADGEFKLRYDGGWDVNRGGTFEEDGTAFAVSDGGSNISLGDYKGKLVKVIYNASDEQVTVKVAWCVIGVVNDTNWSTDFAMRESSNNVWEGAVIANGEFKLRKSGNWDINRGGTLSSLGAAFEVTNNGANIAVPTTDKKYRIVYNAGEETVTVTEF